MARDGMSGALDYSVAMKLAELNGLEGDNLLYFIDFLNELEYERLAKKSKDDNK